MTLLKCQKSELLDFGEKSQPLDFREAFILDAGILQKKMLLKDTK